MTNAENVTAMFARHVAEALRDRARLTPSRDSEGVLRDAADAVDETLRRLEAGGRP